MRYKFVMFDKATNSKLTVTTDSEDALATINRLIKKTEHPEETKLIMAYPEDILLRSIENACIRLYEEIGG